MPDCPWQECAPQLRADPWSSTSRGLAAQAVAAAGRPRVRLPGRRAAHLNHAGSSAPLELLVDDAGPVGWVGWVDYPGAPNAWQTSIFLAPRWRGHGLFPLLRARQHHLAERLPVDVERVTAVPVTDTRVLRLCERYAASQRWAAPVAVLNLGQVVAVWRWPAR